MLRAPTALFMAALALGGLQSIAGPAPSQAAELRVGLLRQDPFSLWATNSNREQAWAANLELGLAPVADVLGGKIAPMLGGTLAAGDNLDTAYAGLTWTYGGEASFFRLGLGGLVHTGNVEQRENADRRRQLGSRVLFHVPIEAGLRLSPPGEAGPAWISVYFSHMSNGYLADPNPGMDSIGVRIGFGF